MANTAWKTTAASNDWLDPANWTDGVPQPGDNVLIPAGTPTITDLQLTGLTITATNGGVLDTNGTPKSASSLNAGSVWNANGGAFLQSSVIDGSFFNFGDITNLNALIGTYAAPDGSMNSGVFTNDGTISQTLNGNALSISAESPLGAAPSFVNNGSLVVSSPAGANGMVPVTQASIGLQASGTGTVSVTGGSPNSAAPPGYPFLTESQLAFSENVSGSMTFDVNDGQLSFAQASSGTVVFQDGAGILNIDDPTVQPSGLTILGFRSGDAIGLGTTQITQASYDSVHQVVDLNGVDASGNAFTLATLKLVATGSQDYSKATFSVATRFLNDIDDTTQNFLMVNEAAPCYCPGTLIATDRGDVPVENLTIGDKVITASGKAKPIRWIGRRSYDGRFVRGRHDIMPIRIRAGALGCGLPRRDLCVSPLHAMHLQGVLVPAAALVNGSSVTQDMAAEAVEYIHIELRRHDLILAEGAVSETFVDDDSRAMFHNASEFSVLYPAERRRAARFCAPRLESGEKVEAIRREIAERAGVVQTPPHGPLRGCVEGLRGAELQGWAQNPERPDVPVCLEVLVDGSVTARVIADRFRGDLRAALIGSGCHGFRIKLPRRVARRSVEVRRAGDHAMLGAHQSRAA